MTALYIAFLKMKNDDDAAAVHRSLVRLLIGERHSAASAVTASTLRDSVTFALSQLTPARPLNWHGIDFSCSLELVVSSV